MRGGSGQYDWCPCRKGKPGHTEKRRVTLLQAGKDAEEHPVEPMLWTDSLILDFWPHWQFDGAPWSLSVTDNPT